MCPQDVLYGVYMGNSGGSTSDPCDEGAGFVSSDVGACDEAARVVNAFVGLPRSRLKAAFSAQIAH